MALVFLGKIRTAIIVPSANMKKIPTNNSEPIKKRGGSLNVKPQKVNNVPITPATSDMYPYSRE